MSDEFRKKINQSRGYGVAEQKREEIEARRGQVTRLWLPPEEGTKIIFLDDNPPIVDEHQLKLDGDWRNWFTCLRFFGESCPICDILQNNPSTVGFYTIIDCSKFEVDGKEYKNTKKLLPAKLKSLKMLEHQSKKRGGLQYAVYDIYRSSSDSVNIGDTYDYEGRLEKEEILKLDQVEDVEPFDYSEILAPKDQATLKQILTGNSQPSVSDDEDEEFEDFEDEDFDVPF